MEKTGCKQTDIRFVADIMVGKLARYLRMCGFDVVYDNYFDDVKIIEIARKQSRIILTRDALMLKRRECSSNTVKSIFIKSTRLAEQLCQLQDELSIIIRPDLTRCIECNTTLESINKASVKDKVPEYVYKTQKVFMFCPVCIKYYWRGTHYENIKKYFDKINI
jgi:uncharacterized protein with PIN domain